MNPKMYQNAPNCSIRLRSHTCFLMNICSGKWTHYFWRRLKGARSLLLCLRLGSGPDDPVSFFPGSDFCEVQAMDVGAVPLNKMHRTMPPSLLHLQCFQNLSPQSFQPQPCSCAPTITVSFISLPNTWLPLSPHRGWPNTSSAQWV